MDRFEQLHPLTILLYYIVAVLIMVFYVHPLLAGIVFFLSWLYYVSRKGIQNGFRIMVGMIGVSLLCVVINPILNHRGVTVLFTVNEMRITKEATLYGCNMAIFLVASLLLFSCFSQVMTAEKVMTLLGKRFPAFSLLFSMILRFVPKAKKDVQEMSAVHGKQLPIWSALIGMSLEDAMERSISMRGRKYNNSKKRTSYYQKKLTGEDWCILSVSGLMTVVGICVIRGDYAVRFFPSISIDTPSMFLWGLVSLFYAVPILMRAKEEISWRLSRRKIINSITLSNPNQP